MSHQYALDKLNEARRAIDAARAETDFRNTAHSLNLRDNVIPALDRIRGALMVELADES